MQEGVDAEAENIQVHVRVRPLLPHESSDNSCVRLEDQDKTLIISRSGGQQYRCSFQHPVISPQSVQADVFSRVSHCVDSVLKGFNSTIFAYGQTGSGKTFTLFGKEHISLSDTPEEFKHLCGIIPRTIDRVFSRMTRGTKVKACFFQVYNENLYDLLLDPRMSKRLTIHDGERGDIHVEGISMYSVSSARDCLGLLQIGSEHRATRETRMNQYSSRSHSIFQLTLERPHHQEATTIRSKLNLVDLSGSEKWDTRGRMVDRHISELTHINLSLHTLGRCIEALTKSSGKSRKRFTPYRDSVLTRLLRDSLGGNTKTCLIATLSPSDANASESISTLKFAERSSRVSMRVSVNRIRKIDLALVERLEREIARLKGLLSAEQRSVVAGDGASSAGVEGKEILRLREENRALKQRLSVENGAIAANSNESNQRQTATMTMSDEHNRHLVNIVDRMRAACAKFFRLEFEEDDLRKEMDRLALASKAFRTSSANAMTSRKGRSAPSTLYSAAAASGVRRSTSPRHDPSNFNRTSRRTQFLSQLKSPRAAGRMRGSDSKTLKYRITGRTSRVVGDLIDPAEAQRRKRERSLRDAERKLAQQEKMMKWAEAKARQQIEEIDREEEHRDRERRERDLKERRWQEHARQQKEKVKRWRAGLSSAYADFDGALG